MSTERRRYARTPLDRPLKLICSATGKLVAARTRNVSAGGLLLETEHPVPLAAGNHLKVGVAWPGQAAVLGQRQLAGATVVRSMALGAYQQIAVRFDEIRDMAASA